MGSFSFFFQGLIDLDSSLAKGFSRTAFFVMDEADRLLEPSFENELTSILECLPSKRQTLLFSATMAASIATLRQGLLRDAFQFEAYTGLQTAENLREEYLFLPLKIKEVYLVHLLEGMKEKGVRSAVVFSSTCKGCQFLSEMLKELDMPCATLHSKLPQKARLSALDKFRSGNVPVLLTTDVGSRGLDIPTVDWVINFDLPKLVKDYVHR